MKERYRVFRKDVCILFIGLLILEVLLFYRDQQKSMGIVSQRTGEDFGITVAEYYTCYQKQMVDPDDEACMRMNSLCMLSDAYRMKTFYPYVEGEISFEEEYLKCRKEVSAEVLEEFDRLIAEDVNFTESKTYQLLPKVSNDYWMRQYELVEYQSRVDTILKNAEKMMKISLYAGSAQAKKNIKKTVEDYTYLKTVKPEIQPDYAVKSLLTFSFLPFICLVAGMMFAIVLSEDQKRGLISILYLAPGGRTELERKRVCWLLLMNTSSVIICYAVAAGTAFAMYGHAEVLRMPIQNLAGYEMCPLPMNQISYILCTAGLQILGTFTLSLLLYSLIAVFRRTSSALMVLVLLFGLEYLPFRLLGRQSAGATLHYLNICYLLQPEKVMSVYENWCKGNVILPCRLLYILFAIGVSVLLLILNLYGLAARKPVASVNGWKRLLIQLEERRNRFVARLTLFGKEAYKLGFMEFGILILAGFIFLNVNNGFTGKLDERRGYYREFYQKFEGTSPGAKLDTYIAEKETELSGLQRKIDDLQDKYQNGEVDELTYSYIYGFDVKKRELSEYVFWLNERRDSYLSLEAKGVQVEIIDDLAYTYILGSVFYEKKENAALFLLAAIVLFATALFAVEKRAGMEPVIRSSAGRCVLYRYKIVLLLTLTTFCWAVECCLEWKNITNQFALKFLSAPIQSVGLMMNWQTKLSIRGFLVLACFRRLMLACAFALLAAVIGERIAAKASLFVGFLLLLPHLIYRCQIAFGAKLSVPILFAGTRLYAEYGKRYWIADALFVGVCMFIFVWNRFRREGVYGA